MICRQILRRIPAYSMIVICGYFLDSPCRDSLAEDKREIWHCSSPSSHSHNESRLTLKAGLAVPRSPFTTLLSLLPATLSFVPNIW